MRNLAVLLITIVITACGTTSGIKQNDEAASILDLSNYTTVVVTAFGDGTEKQSVPEYAGPNFADRIISAIREEGSFDVVTDDSSEISDDALVIHGDITRYAVGNSALKFFIGFGAGSTYFDAEVQFTDLKSNDSLGIITVDKNSWALGGGIAAGQSVEQFMNEAAKKIASELEGAKTPGEGVE